MQQPGLAVETAPQKQGVTCRLCGKHIIPLKSICNKVRCPGCGTDNEIREMK